jgi:hypothetical protein
LRSYSEAIDILYEENAFDIRQLCTLHDLEACVPRHRFDLIRSLQITFALPRWMHNAAHSKVFNADTWPQFWLVVADMNGLRSLRVKLTGIWDQRGTWDTIFEPICVVRHIPRQSFVVHTYLPQKYFEDVKRTLMEEKLPYAPFTFVEGYPLWF